MQIGTLAHGHMATPDNLAGKSRIPPPAAGGEPPSRGERLVARLDGDADGAISLAELAGSRLGRRTSVDRFARMDANGDSRLDAGELDAARRGHRGAAMQENAMRQRFANYLAARVDEPDRGTDVAGRVLERLDSDDSGGLNSEEIAGTRLADLIGGDFYAIDGDRNGALDRSELAGFLTVHVLGAGDQALPVADAGAPLDDAPEPGAVEDAVLDVGETVAAAGSPPVTSTRQATGGSDYTRDISNAFDAALKILQDDAAGGQAYNVVQALYSDVKTILDGVPGAQISA